MLSKGVGLAAGQGVRLPSGLSPSGWSLCPPCLPPVSLCLRACLPSCWSLSPFCLLLSPFLFSFLLVTVSALSPFLFFFLLVIVSPLYPFFLPSCLSSGWSLCPPCLLSVPLCLRSCRSSYWSLCPPCLTSASLFSFLSPFVSSVAVLYMSPSSGLPRPPLACNASHLSPS